MTDAQEAACSIAAAKAVFFDWDGCLASGENLLPGASDILGLLADKAYILSNNSTDHPRDFARRLGEAGVRFPVEHILLAGHLALMQESIRSVGQPVHLVAAPQMFAHAANLGLAVVAEDDGGKASDAETIMILRDTSFTFHTLTQAANASRSAKRIVVANPDFTHPGPQGTVQPETGALFAAIRACLGDREPYIEIFGKPNPALFRVALERAGVAPADAVMVGDNPATDGAGATSTGIAFVHVHPEGPLTMARLAAAVGDCRQDGGLECLSR